MWAVYLIGWRLGRNLLGYKSGSTHLAQQSNHHHLVSQNWKHTFTLSTIQNLNSYAPTWINLNIEEDLAN